ncbi:MAG TPA: DUF5615 family PIN-like protein [Candidatus Angelobacter sp.]
MRLLLDQGLPRSTVPYLQNYGIEAVHVGDRGLATASDSKILTFTISFTAVTRVQIRSGTPR